MHITRKDGELRFEIRAKPKAKRSAIGDPTADVLDVAVTAPPVEGAANEEIVRVLSKALGLRKKDVRIAHGETGKTKVIAVLDIGEAELAARLAAAHAGS